VQTENSVQLLKEQLRLKDSELKKRARESQKLSDKMNNLTVLNREKVNELLGVIKEKEAEAKEAKEAAWAARMSKKAGRGGGTGEGAEEEEIEEGEVGINPKILKELEEYKTGFKTMKAMLKESKGALKKINDDKSLLIKEVKRSRKELDKVKELKAEINNLQKELDQRGGNSYSDMERLLSKQEDKIEKYERIIREATKEGEEGKLPAELIFELRMELNELLHEKEKMIIELEQQKDYIAELELKSQKLEEKQTRGGSGQIENEQRGSFRTTFVSMEGFLVTYSDMITLLLAVFVLLFTMSNVDEDKFAEVLSSFQEKQVRVTSKNVRLTIDEINLLKRVKALLKDNVDPDTLVRSDVKTITFTLKSEQLFAPGSGTLLPGAEQLIFETIKEELTDGVKQIIIEGHTDDVPLSDKTKYPSNWELSTARASAVARYLIDKLNRPPKFMVVTGYGEYRPLVINNSDHNRALNRRVDIKILKDKDVYSEEQKKKNKEKEEKEKSSGNIKRT